MNTSISVVTRSWVCVHFFHTTSNWWTIPRERTKARLDKNRRDHSVYLTPEALELIGTKQGFIFEAWSKPAEANNEQDQDGQDQDEQDQKREIEHISVGAIGKVIRRNKYFGLAPWGAHDLRRTMRTFMSDIDGISVKASEAVLNHALEGVKKNYDLHDYRRQIEKALTLWRDKLVEILGEPLVKPLPDNVISINSGRKVA